MKKRALALLVPAALICLAMTATAQRAPKGPGGATAAPDQNVIHDPMAVPAGTYVVDPQHSAVTGSVRHGGLARFMFRFRRFDARFTYDPAMPDSPKIDVTIDPSSLDTNVSGFDINLVTSDRHFNVPKFPEITFVSNSLKRTGGDKGVMTGNITFVGKTEPLDFDVTFLGVTKGRNGATVGFSATTTIKRSDFGFAEGSADLSDDVAVTVEADFMQQRQR
jgi:polyisoprenoid-binding protein YceI